MVARLPGRTIAGVLGAAMVGVGLSWVTHFLLRDPRVEFMAETWSSSPQQVRHGEGHHRGRMCLIARQLG
jgi:hypothetical protein